MTRPGRLTIPIETGLDDRVRQLIDRLGADAVRNCDGTELPSQASELGTKVYATYFVGRGDQEWALRHPEQRTRLYLMSDRVAASAGGEVKIRIMTGWYAEQVEPDLECDLARWWQVTKQPGSTAQTAGRSPRRSRFR